MILDADDIDLERCLTIAADHGLADLVRGALGLLQREFGAQVPIELVRETPAAPRSRAERRRARSAATVVEQISRPGGTSAFRADWAAARTSLHPASVDGFATFLADRWELETLAQVPLAAGRRLMRRAVHPRS
jgi:hypothetical protein